MSERLVRLLALTVMVGLPVAAACTGAVRLVPFLAMPLVVLGTPMLAGMRAGGGSEHDREDGEDSDDGPGGNRRPDRGPLAPCGPRGTLPLEFSQPASFRLRGHGPQRIADPGRRRAPHRPAPAPGRRTPLRPHVS